MKVRFEHPIIIHDGSIHQFSREYELPERPAVGDLLKNIPGLPQAADSTVGFQNRIGVVGYDMEAGLYFVGLAAHTFPDLDLEEAASSLPGWSYIGILRGPKRPIDPFSGQPHGV